MIKLIEEDRCVELVELLDYHDVRSGLVFCNTQRMVEELEYLADSRIKPPVSTVLS